MHCMLESCLRIKALSLFQTQTKNMELTNILGEETRTSLYVKINYKIKVDKITK